jgi:hypothetical protein
MNRILVAVIVVMLTSCLVPEEKYKNMFFLKYVISPDLLR